MTTVKILGRKGHEELKDLTPEEAKEVIDKLESVEGLRFFVVDLETKKVLKELELQEDQELAVIPIIRGG